MGIQELKAGLLRIRHTPIEGGPEYTEFVPSVYAGVQLLQSLRSYDIYTMPDMNCDEGADQSIDVYECREDDALGGGNLQWYVLSETEIEERAKQRYPELQDKEVEIIIRGGTFQDALFPDELDGVLFVKIRDYDDDPDQDGEGDGKGL